MGRHRVEKIWVDDTAVYVRTVDGLEANYPFYMWQRLANATQEQREDFYPSYSGIHWPQIDEDLGFESMFAHAGMCEVTETEDSVFYSKNYTENQDECTFKVAED